MIVAVVPTLGESPLVLESLRALRRQSVGGDAVEVILVRQGRLHHGRAPDPEIEDLCHRVITVERNLGFAGATNLGIAVARELATRDRGPRLIATVNDDLEVAPGWAESLAAALESEPEAAAVQGVNLRLDDPGRVDGCGLGWNRWWQAVQLHRGELAPRPETPVEEIFGVSATAALYRTEALDRVEEASSFDGQGPFDPGLGSYYEDVDLACRLRALGSRALLVPRARAFHAGSATGGRMSFRRWRWIYGNRPLVLARLLGRRFSRELPRILARDLRDLLRAGTTLRLRRAAAVPAGWGRAARHLPAYVHRGAPRVALPELERFRVSSPP
jgi:GT2 family glycosyltransferase